MSTPIVLPQTEGPSACRIAITRLQADGANPAGTWDQMGGSQTFGTYLHLRVAFPTEGANRVSTADPAAVPPLMDFDPEGVVIFPPMCSQIQLVGGQGLYGVTAEVVPIVPNGYAPRVRRLLRYLPEDGQFIVPSGHAGIGTNDATATLENISDGGTLNLTSSWPYLIPAGTILKNPNPNPVLVWTTFEA